MKKIFNNPLGIKFAFVLFLLVILQIPVSMVSHLISERAHRQNEVKDEIARSSTGEQRIVGPFMVVEFSKLEIQPDETKKRVAYRQFILPDTFDMNANLDGFEKYRGIYHARLFKAQTALKGTFDLAVLDTLRQFDITKISLVVGIEDSRGLIRLDDMMFAGKTLNIEPGTGLRSLPQGIHSNFELLALETKKPLTFELNFLLQGMGQLQVTPIGKRTTVEFSSGWPSPSFIGDYLPVSSDISTTGFKAQWSSNNFSSNIEQLFTDCLANNTNCQKFKQRQMGVNLIDPVDHYLKSHRAVNYSLLVICLVFVSFFLLEVFQARPVHPVQYGFVGLALALFYLLLISMSEHIGFNLSYVISAVASTGLLSLYVGGMLNHSRHGVMFGGCLLVLYSLLFGLLQAESYALLMGTILCFVILSVVMLLTRKINWYEHSHKMSRQTSDMNHDAILS